MKPVKAADSNLLLILDEQGKGDLPARHGPMNGAAPSEIPAQKLVLIDPSDGTAGEGFETTWEPDDGERRAIVNGAPIILNVWGSAHPPVSLEVGEPPEDAKLKAQYSHDHVMRAFAYFMRRLSRRILLTAQFPTEPSLVVMYAEESIKVTHEQVDVKPAHCLVESPQGDLLCSFEAGHGGKHSWEARGMPPNN